MGKINLKFPMTPRRLDWLVILIALAGLTISLNLGWQAMQPKAAITTVVTVVSSGDSTAIPPLTLNNAHKRQGEQIIVDLSKIGKQDPFAR